MEKREIGNLGEDIASAFLQQKGYAVIRRNFLCRVGEIDIIAQKDEYLCFVEVKLRRNASYGEAREFVTRSKQKKIILAAKYYLSKNLTELQPRFDVVEVYMPDGTDGKTYVRLLENAIE